MRLPDERAEDEEGKLRPVWFVLDEVALLQKLPKLRVAITRNRKTNNPVVLGFQGRTNFLMAEFRAFESTTTFTSATHALGKSNG
jgi:hypothetical protein